MNRRQRRRGSHSWGRLVAVVVIVASLAAGGFGWTQRHNRKSPAERYLTTDVRRADLFPTRIASGRLESGKRTIIECKLENVAVGVRGQRLTAGGASVLLSVIPQGTDVKRGDVLAVLDSSDYEELLRLQRITFERSKSDKLQAELDVEIARLAVREFEEGTVKESIEQFEGNIFLARSDLERSIDRLNWSRRMNEKGYVPAASVTTDKFRKDQMALALTQQEAAYQVFKKFTAPRTMKELEGAVKGAVSMLDYQQLRLRRQAERLKSLERQVENCTIRAPHDGFVIYANNAERELFIEPGLPVRQWQHLFYLPDLSDMEVVAMLHESFVDKINPGMRATVAVEGLSNRQIEAHVTSIAPMATFNWRTDVQYFEGIVKLENVPAGLRPGMSAEVEIALPRRENVLAVPSEAVRLENGHDVCFVVHDDRLERREVKLGHVTPDLSEVTEGLAEGEQVVLNPPKEELDSDFPSGRTDLISAVPTPKTIDSAGDIAALR
jgi:HlyD family secretion protein